MSAQSTAALTTANDNNVVLQTSPESITPGLLGSNVIQQVIDSMWNRVDDLLTLPPVSVTKAVLAAAIGASSLNNRTNGFSDKQWVQINDRTDTYPLFVQINGAGTISPFGVWVKAGKPLAVIMDYVNGYQGETLPFIAVFDENRKLNLPNQIIIADGSQAADKVLVSDANGASTWKIAQYYQGGVLNPASLPNGPALMLGLAGAITPSKTGKVMITIAGEYVSGTTTVDTVFVIKTGTGAAPANGAANTGTAQLTTTRHATHATNRNNFSITVIAALTPGTAYWIDMAAANNGGASTDFFNTTISAIEM